MCAASQHHIMKAIGKNFHLPIEAHVAYYFDTHIFSQSNNIL